MKEVHVERNGMTLVYELTPMVQYTLVRIEKGDYKEELAMGFLTYFKSEEEVIHFLDDCGETYTIKEQQMADDEKVVTETTETTTVPATEVHREEHRTTGEDKVVEEKTTTTTETVESD